MIVAVQVCRELSTSLGYSSVGLPLQSASL